MGGGGAGAQKVSEIAGGTANIQEVSTGRGHRPQFFSFDVQVRTNENNSANDNNNVKTQWNTKTPRGPHGVPVAPHVLIFGQNEARGLQEVFSRASLS